MKFIKERSALHNLSCLRENKSFQDLNSTLMCCHFTWVLPCSESAQNWDGPEKIPSTVSSRCTDVHSLVRAGWAERTDEPAQDLSRRTDERRSWEMRRGYFENLWCYFYPYSLTVTLRRPKNNIPGVIQGSQYLERLRCQILTSLISLLSTQIIFCFNNSPTFDLRHRTLLIQSLRCWPLIGQCHWMLESDWLSPSHIKSLS